VVPFLDAIYTDSNCDLTFDVFTSKLARKLHNIDLHEMNRQIDTQMDSGVQ